MKNDFTLLYVEDEKIIRESFTEIFKTQFKKVLTAENGEDGLKIYQENDIDIAVLDISVPKMDGLTLAKKIREENDNIEIIMLTAHSEKDRLLEAMGLSLFYYLVKPVKKAVLDKTLGNVIEKLHKKSTVAFANNYSFNMKTQTLYYKDESIKLSKNEKKLVDFLSHNIHTHHSACDIAAFIHNSQPNDSICNNTIQLISRFKRKMLELHPDEEFFIEKIYGLGYQIRR